ncbi:MAG: MBL fold metallo-hydrolase [Patescibacteria group bacterium]
MKINFIGLSCFIIENNRGFRILIDPFNNAPEWSLGPKFPNKFRGRPLGANIVLMSEPDADHAYAPGGWLQAAPKTKPNGNAFPDLDLRGTLVYEWNGDLNIAWHYTVDGLRLLHLADNAHLLTREQLREMRKPDILFISAPKAESDSGLEMTRKNIKLLAPKIIIWAHHLAPKGMPDFKDKDKLRNFFRAYFKKNAFTSKGYKGPESFMSLCSILENAYTLNAEYNGLSTKNTTLEINTKQMRKRRNTKAILFTNMIAKP